MVNVSSPILRVYKKRFFPDEEISYNHSFSTLPVFKIALKPKQKR